MAADATNSQRKFKLVCSDGVIIEATQGIINQSEVLKELTALQNPSEEEISIPINNIPTKTLQNIVYFAKRYETAEPYIPPKSGNEAIEAAPAENHWDIIFLKKLSTEEFVSFICGTNYLNMPRLMDAATYTLNYLVKGKSVEEMRQFFQLENDFTEQDKQDNERHSTWYPSE